jgi:hypothetical protein
VAEAACDGPVLKPPFADKGWAARFDHFARCRVDYIFVVGADFFMEALGGVGEETTVLMHSATLHPRRIPNGGDLAFESRAASTIRSSGRRRPRLMTGHVPGSGKALK